MSQADDDIDVALTSILTAIDALAAERGWKKKRRKLRSPVLRALSSRVSAPGIWSNADAVEVSTFSERAGRALELTRRSEWDEAESALALAFESFARVVSASGTVVVSCEAPGSVAGVRISAIGAGCSVGIGVTITNVEISDIRLHGEPGLAPTKLPAPPKPDAD